MDVANFGKIITTIIWLLITIAASAPFSNLDQGADAISKVGTLARRAETIVYKGYTVTYFDTPSQSVPDTVVNGVPRLAATAAASYMRLVVCTNTPIYNGNCITLQLAEDGCVDFPVSSPWDNSISSMAVTTTNTLCRLYRGHSCGDNVNDPSLSTYLNEGDTSRDKIKLQAWNNDVSSLACYWDLRGVTGEWNAASS